MPITVGKKIAIIEIPTAALVSAVVTIGLPIPAVVMEEAPLVMVVKL